MVHKAQEWSAVTSADDGINEKMEPPGAWNWSIVVHEDALDTAPTTASADALLLYGSADVARAVTPFGAGIVVLPMCGKVSGVADRRSLSYAAHRLTNRKSLVKAFGQLEPQRLVDELAGGMPGLEQRLSSVSDGDLQAEVSALQAWRAEANGRLQTLEKRAAFDFLGLQVGRRVREGELKRAIRRKYLKVHPDKGGDAKSFRRLQEVKDLLLELLAKEAEVEEMEKEQEGKKDAEKAMEKQDKDKGRDEGRADRELSADGLDSDEEFWKTTAEEEDRRRSTAEEEGFWRGLESVPKMPRERLEGARKRLQNHFMEVWQRVVQLTDEIKQSEKKAGSSSDAMRQLQRFAGRFAGAEVGRLAANGRRQARSQARRIFQRFLEQGAEVLAAAAAVDPAGSVLCVQRHLCCPLRAAAPDLQQCVVELQKAIEGGLPKLIDLEGRLAKERARADKRRQALERRLAEEQAQAEERRKSLERRLAEERARGKAAQDAKDQETALQQMESSPPARPRLGGGGGLSHDAAHSPAAESSPEPPSREILVAQIRRCLAMGAEDREAVLRQMRSYAPGQR